MKKSTKKKLKKIGREIFYFEFFRLLYISGLAFLVPFVMSYDLPEEIGIWSGTQEALLVISLFLIVFSFYGVYTRKHKLNKTLKSMGMMTLIPGFLSLFFGIFGKPIFTSIAQTTPNYQQIAPIIDLAINELINRVWYLTISFIILGLTLYYLGKQME